MAHGYHKSHYDIVYAMNTNIAINFQNIGQTNQHVLCIRNGQVQIKRNILKVVITNASSRFLEYSITLY